MVGENDEALAPESEAAIASVLRAAMGDSEFWALLPCVSSAEETGRYFAERAVSLYQRTSPLLERRLFARVQPSDYAIGALREIADAAAMLSHPWTENERLTLGVPDRNLIESAIRAFGVDSWAQSHGQTLAMLTSESTSLPPESNEYRAWINGPRADEFAAIVVQALETYAKVLPLRETNYGRALATSEAFRVAAIKGIGIARAWLLWSRRQEGTEPQSLAEAFLLTTQATFITSTEFGDTVLFPSRQWLSELLYESGALDWLQARTERVPNWLSPM
jgi:hypothetical protein